MALPSALFLVGMQTLIYRLLTSYSGGSCACMGYLPHIFSGNASYWMPVSSLLCRKTQMGKFLMAAEYLREWVKS